MVPSVEGTRCKKLKANVSKVDKLKVLMRSKVMSCTGQRGQDETPQERLARKGR